MHRCKYYHTEKKMPKIPQIKASMSLKYNCITIRKFFNSDRSSSLYRNSFSNQKSSANSASITKKNKLYSSQIFEHTGTRASICRHRSVHVYRTFVAYNALLKRAVRTYTLSPNVVAYGSYICAAYT